MNREARRLEKEIKEVLEEMSSDQEAKVSKKEKENQAHPSMGAKKLTSKKIFQD